MNHSNNWMPSVQMPPLGFGVVMPQPGGAGALPPSFQMTNQTGNQGLPPVKGQDNVGALWQYQQFNVGQQTAHPYPQRFDANSHQVLLAQQKAAQEQRLLYEKMMKQRQFDEQKERLKELGSRIKKVNNVSADAMIQNIFEKQGQCTAISKPRNKRDYPLGAPFNSDVDKVTVLGQSCAFNPAPLTTAYLNQSLVQGLPVFSTKPQPQPSQGSGHFISGGFETNEISKTSSISIGPSSLNSAYLKCDEFDRTKPTIFTNPMTTSLCSSTLQPSDSRVAVGQNPHAVTFSCSTSPSTSVTMSNTQYSVMDSGQRAGMPMITSTIAPSASSRAPDSTFEVNQSVKTLSLKLPSWLVDVGRIPEIYCKASALVQAEEDWVDTSRAYMLLMQTNVPPHFLGILWEMVNKTQPGRLRVIEFHALLALVACVQSGKSFVSVEVLTSLEAPVYPLIDHPALLPLAQRELHKQQKQIEPHIISSGSAVIPLNSDLDLKSSENVSVIGDKSVVKPTESVSNSSVKLAGFNAVSLLPSQSSESCPDFDDFDDFVSAPPAGAGTLLQSESATSSFNIVPPPLPIKITQHSDVANNFSKNVSNSSSKSNRVKNLPILGNSPLNHSKTKEMAQSVDDDFDDFQSAPPPISQPTAPTSNLPFSPLPQRIRLSKEEKLVVKESELHNNMREDKYAVFRDLFEGENNTESCGEIKKEKADTSVSVPFETNFPQNSYVENGLLEEENINSQNLKGLSTAITTASTFSVNTMISNLLTAVTSTTTAAAAASAMISNLNEWYSSDPFGEFDSKQGSQSLTEGSSESSNYITANASADTSNDDDDFGDFVGPTEFTSDKPTNFAVSAPNVSELMSETQSVASLELPGLELTVNLAGSNDYGNLGSRAEVCTTLSKNDEWMGTEKEIDEQFQSLRLDGDDPENIPRHKEFGPEESSLTISSVPLSDKYSIIREGELKKNDLIDPHIDLWKRCLKACKKLLEEGLSVVSDLRQNASLLKQVLETSQMNDYLTNLKEVWEVGKRISASNSKADSNPAIKDLSSAVHQLWVSICHNLDREIEDRNGSDSDSINLSPLGECDKGCCNLCLCGGDVSLFYGGHSYHPPCANLWLNVVDLTLPLVSNSRPTLL